MKCAGGQQKNGPLCANPLEFVVFECRRLFQRNCQDRFQASERLGGGQDTQSSGLSNGLRPVIDTESAGKLQSTWAAKALALGSVPQPEFDYVH
jgi:hypothetical protein